MSRSVWSKPCKVCARSSTPPPPVVVVDNASAVPLPTLAGAWVLRAPERLMLGAARNLGLTQVDTPYVVFWDADDVMLDGTLSFLEAAISADPTVVAFGTAVLDEASGRRHRWPRRWIKRLVGSPHRFEFLNAIWSLYPSTGSTIMRTDAVRAAGGYSDADSGDDGCWAYRWRSAAGSAGANGPDAFTASTPALPWRSTWRPTTCSDTREWSASASAPIRASRSGRGGRYLCSGSASVRR